MGDRGNDTKTALIEAGERLMAERGINGVSTREINIAAGQRNTAALHYHFGSKEGLLRAIVDKHQQAHHQRRRELMEAVESEGRTTDLRSLVEVMIRPLAEMLDESGSERAFTLVAAQLISDPDISFEEVLAMVEDPVVHRATRLIGELDLDLPAVLLGERIELAMIQAVEAVAYRARLESARRPKRRLLPTEIFISNQIDMAVAAMEGPVSADTRALLAAL
ncbi:MAG: hypothetical protein JJLCMIEE_01672 [Acidimicrobiales bacterium]|nr:MAG: TetR/AcrR family transcriptional regulator [Actinomycetota bacterium]MBV6508607.1 hypothetical protein [Acidimicrobiales bacterium]RIK08064.1 MAG: hypothetical protein DCC48_01330 [Acidobacteriota bacterium]